MTVSKGTGESSDFNVKDYLKLSFDLVNTKLASIDEKATKTEASVQGVIRTINHMKILNAGHFTNCPNTVAYDELDKKIDKEIQIINTKISKYEFIINYWKVFAISGAVTIVGLMLSGYLAFQKIDDILNNTEKNVKNKENGISEETVSPLDNTTVSTYTVH